MEFQATIPFGDGKPNRNGRIYTKDSFLALDYNVPVFLNYKEERDFDSIVGYANVSIKDSKMDIKITVNRFEEIINSFSDDVKPVFCCKSAKVDEDGNIYNADITEIFFTKEPAFTDIKFTTVE